MIPFQQHGMSSGRVVTNLQTQVSRHWHYIQMERGWAPMLLASAAVASSSEEGAEFMSLIYPDTYQNASGLELANTLKRLFSYTTSNALYNDFDTAYNNFFTGKAAMVPNGYWMIDRSLTDGNSVFVFLLSLGIHWFLLRKHLAGH